MSKDGYKWTLTIKGGPGSGHWGHAGRPGKVGGSQPGGGYSTIGFTFVGNVVGKAKQNAVLAWRDLPEEATAGASVVLHEGGSYGFEAGGQNFQAAASWSNYRKEVSIYDTNQYDWDMDRDRLRRIYGHEVGHKMFDEWWDREVRDSSWAFREHEDWFDAGGNLKPEYAKAFQKISPLTASKSKFLEAWEGGEDGITDYSRAWAKEGHWSETAAEMSEIYFNDGLNELIDVCVKSGAENLMDAFLEAMEIMGVP